MLRIHDHSSPGIESQGRGLELSLELASVMMRSVSIRSIAADSLLRRHINYSNRLYTTDCHYSHHILFRTMYDSLRFKVFFLYFCSSWSAVHRLQLVEDRLWFLPVDFAAHAKHFPSYPFSTPSPQVAALQYRG